MTDHNTTQGAESAIGGFNVASKAVQTFASEVTRMSKESIANTTQLVEKLRGAKTIEDVVSIQTNFMQQSFTHYADYTRRFGEMVTMLPLEMAKQARTALQSGTDVVSKTTEQASQQVQHVAEQVHHDTQTYNNGQNYNNNQNHDNSQGYDNNQGYNNNNQNYNNDYNNNNNYNNNNQNY